MRHLSLLSPLALLLSAALASSACASPTGDDTALAESSLVTCGGGSHRVCTKADPGELPPGSRPPPLVCTCVQDPKATASLVRVIGVQPGWVRATFAVSVTGDTSDVTVSADVTCAQGPRESVRVLTHSISPTLLAVDVRADLDWLAANQLPLPCAASRIDVTYAWSGGTLATATSPYPFQMDLPLSHLNWYQLNAWPGYLQIPLRPPPSTRRHFAYTPQIIAIATADMQVTFVEVEELPERRTVGLRGAATFSWQHGLERELGGGAEIFPGWGLDVHALGVTKATSGLEESHAGFDAYAYGGTILPALSTNDKSLRIYPAPPLVSEAEYTAHVLDNHGVPRCLAGSGCLDIVYDADAHVLRAGAGAGLMALDDGPIQPGITPTSDAPMAPSTSMTAPPPSLTSSRARAASSGARPARTTLSPEEQRIADEALLAPKATGPIVRAAKCALNATNDGSTTPLTRCGGRTSATHCPTSTDPVHADSLPPAPGDGYSLSVSRLMPVYAARENLAGSCGTHTQTQYYEALVNKLMDDVVPRRGLSIDGEWVSTPHPRVAYSPAAALVDLYTHAGVQSGDPDFGDAHWPKDGTTKFMPQTLDAYWPARERDFADWVENASPAAREERGHVLVEKCRGTSGDAFAAFWNRAFCVGQGQVPPGAYWNYSTQVVTMGQDSSTGGAWSLANTYFDVKSTSIALDDRDVATQAVIATLRSGLPVAMTFPVYSADIADGAGGRLPLRSEMSWFLPPELAGCDADLLRKAFQVDHPHAANIIGYVLSGPIDAPDPITSFFLIENNWGKQAGDGGFFAMSFAAFKMLAKGVGKAQLVCGYPSIACAPKP